MKFGVLVSILACTFMSMTPGPASAHQIVCESSGRERTFCRADLEGGVRLVRDYGRYRCVERENWGWDRNGVWVSSGCRAVFETLSDNDDLASRRDYARGYNDGLRGRYDRDRLTQAYRNGYRAGERDRYAGNRPGYGVSEADARLACSARLAPG